MLGHLRDDLGHVDDLAGDEAGRGALVEFAPAALTARRPVVDDGVGDLRHGQARAGRTALLALAAGRPCLALRSLLGLALALVGRVTRRRLARVPRVLAQLTLQLRYARLKPLVLLAERRDQLRLRGHQRLQFGVATSVGLDLLRLARHGRWLRASTPLRTSSVPTQRTQVVDPTREVGEQLPAKSCDVTIVANLVGTNSWASQRVRSDYRTPHE